MEANRHQPRQPVTTAIRELREDAIALCSRVNDHAKTSKVPPEENLTRTLSTELRLFGGNLFSLETLASEVERDDPSSGDLMLGTARQLPCLRRLREPLDSVRARLRSFAPYDVEQAKGEVLASRATVTYVLAKARTCADFITLLSVVYHGNELSTEPEDICDWLQVLNSPFNNRRPREHNLEGLFLEARRAEFPQYSHAAKSWPFFARIQWPTVQELVRELFALPRSWNFVQWALEFARTTLPATFGPTSLDNEATIHLTNALCDESITPLHFAAALGLWELCDILIAGGADVNAAGNFGSPLYSALLGTEVLAVRDSPLSWPNVFAQDDYVGARSKAILKLLDCGADVSYRFRGPDGQTVSLAVLAFWHSLDVNSYTVFKRFVAAGVELDENFADVVTQPYLMDRTRASPNVLSILLTSAFDAAFTLEDSGLADVVASAIVGVMHDCKIDMVPDPELGGRLATVSDEMYPDLVVDAVRDDEILYFKRLAMDPRFDPKQPAPQHDGGTIAHLAVGGGQHEMVEALIEAGTDFTVRDDEGRTPFLLVDNTDMLHLFVANSIPTTDADHRGRNIWHYAAANNDVCFLATLSSSDPARKQNMVAVNNKGSSPLDKALRHAEKLQKVHEPLSWCEPHAARYLLELGANLKLPAPYPRILSAVEWGDLDLVEKLVAGGENVTAANEIGMNALHHLNLYACHKLVTLLEGLCGDMPIAVDKRINPFALTDKDRDRHDRNAGLTPAETIFNNTRLFADGKRWVRSQHPSCRTSLSCQAYRALLTPKVLAYRDSSNACTWERFCARVVTQYELYLDPESTNRDLEFYCVSIVTAIESLKAVRALDMYEERTGEPAVMCLARFHDDPEGPTYKWLQARLPFVRAALEGFDTPLTEEFYGGDEVRAMSELVADTDFDTMWWLELKQRMDAAYQVRKRAAAEDDEDEEEGEDEAEGEDEEEVY
ncbi:ankyrin repeat domain protein [Purpureocillium lavendulum]|uniref:Ankyrin repeat domain protein n=1 Tax=Purpureocillium lavendulum TaxID=1247861 RepID=A0AB34G1F6_9HYPO|nr:ankyrin repeat domain protein [Purpureocillium lavendulum]